MSDAPAQLVLRFPRTPGFSAAELLDNAAQAEARAWLDQPTPWPLGRLAIWGPPGVGKSHLAHAWAEASGGIVLSAPPAGGWPGGPIALDAIDGATDELALLYLLNAAQESGHPVLLVSRAAPARIPVRLPDLASRLRATTAIGIEGADEPFLAQLLARLLAAEQVRLPPALQTWLLTRLPRSPGAIRDAVQRLNAAALTAGRTLTRPFAAEVLGFCDKSPPAPAAPSPQARTAE